MHMTVSGGRRASTANAYLRPARRRRNLTVLTRTHARRVLFDGRRAIGVEIERGGTVQVLRTRREVVLSAGAIGSPAILQRSGIGPARVLAPLGIPLVIDLPGVGANLQDHLEVYVQYRCTRPITLNGRLGLLSRALIGARWLLMKDGLGASNHFEACAFIRSDRGVRWPDVQYHFLPAAMRYDGRAAFAGHGFQVHVGPNRPRSRGRVRLRSPHPQEAPSIRFDYLTAPRDVEDWRRVISLTREIMAQPALSAYRGEEIQPGPSIASQEAIDAWVRANVESAYHPCGTCAMGAPTDPAAVLDPECRVRGADGLRVVDASVFPSIPNGNINAPTIMIAERVADMLRGRALLPPAHVDVWLNPNWKESQR
jgi:choline dehydrogenase